MPLIHFSFLAKRIKTKHSKNKKRFSKGLKELKKKEGTKKK